MGWENFGKQLDEERMERLREIVDPICHSIIRRELTLAEAEEAILNARLEASYVISDQMELYDMIYGRRFERLLEQFPPERIG